jgi:DNA (cytosine-5)-methyltransferase 1
MSWLFSQALVEEYLGDICSDGELSAPLNGNPIQLAYLSQDKMTKFSRLSRFGMTFKPLTENRGEELLTSYLADFRAKTSAQPEKARELMEPDRECGATWRESLARYDPATSLWRTPQCSLLEDSIEFSETWPRWGLMRDGVSYQQQTLVPHIREKGSGLWPTPTTMDTLPARDPELLAEANRIRGGRKNRKALSNLREAIFSQHYQQMWPTPIAQDAKHSGYAQSGPGKADKLSYAVVRDLWPTPTAHNAKETNAPSEALRNEPSLASRVGGTLNPTWVEWLMGWPLGWTDLKRLEMDKYQQWQQQHGIY